MVDSAGVALAAIQALARRVEQLDARVRELEADPPDAVSATRLSGRAERDSRTSR